ncbi:hypothetical protein [Psychroserpens sp.]|uniref:hypothetical protein n=1 Tax=Psychroserpens sp. TaxID=2020870 RepID=UPI002B26B6AC|nr:hypothetical protein [Psychroserpens sp.]
MIRNLAILVFTLFTLFTYGQRITFQKNVNHKARALKQSLTKNGDSLILESKKNIGQVDIFNEDFFESIDIDSTKTKIDLKMLPIGSFIVQARLGKKRIIMYLRKSDNYEIDTKQPKFKLRKVYKITSSELDAIDVTTSKTKRKSKTTYKKKDVKFYWVVYESNSNFGSRKSMKLAYKNELPELIKKNKLELQSKVGSDNVLRIYAIYNKNKFMRKQFRNPKYYKTVKKSKLFNVKPYYNSLNE